MRHAAAVSMRAAGPSSSSKQEGCSIGDEAAAVLGGSQASLKPVDRTESGSAPEEALPEYHLADDDSADQLRTLLLAGMALL